MMGIAFSQKRDRVKNIISDPPRCWTKSGNLLHAENGSTMTPSTTRASSEGCLEGSSCSRTTRLLIQ